MKRKFTLLLTGLLPAFVLSAQDLPVKVLGNVTLENVSTKSESSMTVFENGYVNLIDPNGALSVDKPLTLQAGASKGGIIENGGTVNLGQGVGFQSNDATDGKLANKGTVNWTSGSSTSAGSDIQVLKTFNSGWYYVSFPFDVASITDMNDGTEMVLNQGYKLLEYDGNKRSTTGKADSWKDATAGIKANVGYAIIVSNGTIGHTIRFSATENTKTVLYPGAKAMPIAFYHSSIAGLTQKSFGWNYIGNSHTSSFLLNRSTTNYRGVAQVYSRTAGSYLPSKVSDSDANDTPGTVAPFAAVFVQSNADGQSVTLNSGGIETSNPTLRAGQSGANNFRLKIAGNKNTYYDLTQIAIGTAYSPEYKFSEDAIKWFSPEATAPQVWSLSKDNEQLAINMLPEVGQGSVPLGYSVGVAGSYTLSMEEDNLQGSGPVWLNDRELNSKVNLREGSYSFVLTAKATSSDRFFISFQNAPTDIKNIASDKVQIYASGGYCHVKGVQAGDRVLIYDVSGRKVSQDIATGTLCSYPLFAKGTYIVKVSGSVTQVTKVLN